MEMTEEIANISNIIPYLQDYIDALIICKSIKSKNYDIFENIMYVDIIDRMKEAGGDELNLSHWNTAMTDYINRHSYIITDDNTI
jgi:hypothetical protein